MAILGYKTFEDFNQSEKFGLSEWLKRRGLAGWLEIATDGLEASAKSRIAEEIGTHYSEAVSAHMADGEPELSAQVTALAELGDPQDAAKRFRKRHLTETQVNSMRWREGVSAIRFFSFWMLPLDILPLAVFFLLSSHLRQISWFRLLAVAVLIAFVGLRAVPRLLRCKAIPRNSFLKALALSTFLTEVAIAVPYTLFLYTINHKICIDVSIGIWILINSNWKSNSPFRIWNKLRNMPAEQFGLPPSQTSSS